MEDANKTKKQLISELLALRHKNAELEVSECLRSKLESSIGIITEIPRGMDLTTISERINREVAALLDVELAALYLWSEGTQVLVPYAWHGFGTGVGKTALRLGEGLVGIVAERRIGMVFNEYQNSVHVPSLFVERTDVTAVLAEPLLYHENIFGVSLLAYCGTRQSFTPQEHELICRFAVWAAITIENVRLVEERSRQLEQLSRILEINKRIAFSEDMESLLSHIAQEAARLVCADGASVRVRQGDTLIATSSTSCGSASAGVPEVSLGEGITGRTVSENRVIVVPDIAADSDVLPSYRERATEVGICAFASIPIRGRLGVIGVLSVTSLQPREFTADEISALSICTEQAVIAIEHAQLIEEVRDRTSRLESINASLQSEMIERKQIEQVLQDSEERFRNLIEGSIQGILIHRDNQALFVNQAYANIFGYETPDEIYALETLLSLIAPHERERLLGYRDARITGQAVPRHYEYQGVHKDGSQLWLDMTVRVISWHGQPAVQSIVTDVSERKRAEFALQDSEERFRNLIEGSIQGILIHRDDKALFLNQAYADIFGYETRDEILRMDLLISLVAPHERERLQQYRADRLAGKCVPVHYEYQAVRKDGSKVWLDTVVRVVNWYGAPATLMTVFDITKQKILREHLRQSVRFLCNDAVI